MWGHEKTLTAATKRGQGWPIDGDLTISHLMHYALARAGKTYIFDRGPFRKGLDALQCLVLRIHRGVNSGSIR